MTDLFTLYQILKQVAIDLKPIKSFAVIDEPHQINSDNFGLSKHHANYGTYWSIHGISFNENTAEYPALLVENVKTSRLGSVTDRKFENDIYISVAQPENFCDGVIEKIDVQNTEYLRAFLQELFSYYKYETAEGMVYMSKGRANLLGEIRKCAGIFNDISQQPLEIFTSGKGVDSIRMKSVMLSISTCINPDIELDYNQKDYSAGVVKCSVC